MSDDRDGNELPYYWDNLDDDILNEWDKEKQSIEENDLNYDCVDDDYDDDDRTYQSSYYNYSSGSSRTNRSSSVGLSWILPLLFWICGILLGVVFPIGFGDIIDMFRNIPAFFLTFDISYFFCFLDIFCAEVIYVLVFAAIWVTAAILGKKNREELGTILTFAAVLCAIVGYIYCRIIGVDVLK